MIYSAAIPTNLHQELETHLLREDGQEDLCFALWYPSQGNDRFTALLQTAVKPNQHDRTVHGNASFLPAYIERVIEIALQHNAGIAFLHSHLGPGWQGMSGDDIEAEQRLAAAVQSATGLPLLGLTLGTDGAWSARFWHKIAPRKYQRVWCSTVRVTGSALRITANELLVTKFSFRPELTRTISAWGENEQQNLMRLRIGIVGLGSVGSIVAETLARMGVGHISLIDFDPVEQINLDRILHSTRWDALLRRPKIQVIARAIKKSATANPFTVSLFDNSIAEEIGFRAALDCDVLFSCVDRPWARSILNFIAYAHLIPVVDGGIRAERKRSSQGLLRADWRTQTIAPTRPCLECLGQYNSGDVAAERDGYFDKPSYVSGLPNEHFLKHNENVFPFSLSLAAQEIQHFLAMTLSLPGGLTRAPEIYHFVQNDTQEIQQHCHPNCLFPSYVAYGDRAPIKVTARHEVAESARKRQIQYKKTFKYWYQRLVHLNE